MRFGGPIFCKATSNSPGIGPVTLWGSGLLIWIETGLWKQGVSFLELFKINDKAGHMWVFGGLLFCNATSDRLETGWVTHWGSGLSVWIETGLWKQGVSFLELSKFTGRTGRICDLEGFYSDLTAVSWSSSFSCSLPDRVIQLQDHTCLQCFV